MIDHHILEDLVATFAIGLVLVVGLARVRVPAIVALMIAGIVAGPSGLGIVDTTAQVEMLAEIGVVLLLFTVGLDFSLATVKQIWRRIVVGGSLQIAFTAVLVIAVLAVTAISLRLAIFIGLFVAL